MHEIHGWLQTALDPLQGHQTPLWEPLTDSSWFWKTLDHPVNIFNIYLRSVPTVSHKISRTKVSVLFTSINILEVDVFKQIAPVVPNLQVRTSTSIQIIKSVPKMVIRYKKPFFFSPHKSDHNLSDFSLSMVFFFLFSWVLFKALKMSCSHLLDTHLRLGTTKLHSVTKSNQQSYLSERKDMVLKYKLSNSESHIYA